MGTSSDLVIRMGGKKKRVGIVVGGKKNATGIWQKTTWALNEKVMRKKQGDRGQHVDEW